MQVAAPSPSPTDDALLAYLDPILNDTCADAPHLAVALSGGPDSMAMALLARDWCDARGKQLTTLTVDHQLRAESAIEAQQVAAWMRGLGINHHILTPKPLPEIANIQSRARQMRYGALTYWCATKHVTHLLLGHHYDDQAETVALQKHRGTTPPSRAGMALVAERDGVRLVRPLLGTSKKTLLAYLETHGQRFIDDPSNGTDFFARNRLRRLLGRGARQALWREAQANGERRHAEDIARAQWMAAHSTSEADAFTLALDAWRALEEETRTDILSHAIRIVGQKEFRPRHHETLRLDARVMDEPSGASTLGHCRIRWSANTLAITPEHPLEAAASHAYMSSSPDPKALGNMPFWWFNYPPFNDGASIAPA